MNISENITRIDVIFGLIMPINKLAFVKKSKLVYICK